MYKLRVKLTFQEEILGSESCDIEDFKDYILSKAENLTKEERKDEINSIENAIKFIKGEEVENEEGNEKESPKITIFPRDEEGKPFMYNYMIKGFFKNAGKSMNYIYSGDKDKKLSAYKSHIDNCIQIKPRKIFYQIPEGKNTGICQRPLRANTPQGDRVAISTSESIPEGTTVEFTILILEEKLYNHVKEWLNYGEVNGLGQWHNSGKGIFTWEIIKELKTEELNYDEFF